MPRGEVEQRPVPIVRIVAPDSAGRVLLLRRRATSQGGGMWCLPGGKVDYGQTVAQAVVRELQEETTLVCEEARFLFLQDSLPTGPGGMHGINLYFECRTSGEVILNAESTAWVRVGPEDLSRYEVAFRGAEALDRFWTR